MPKMLSPLDMYTNEEFANMSQEKRDQIIAANAKWYEAVMLMPHRSYNEVTESAKTRDGGVVEVAEDAPNVQIDGLKVARVGDKVRYPDGRVATIISGAGVAHIIAGASSAIVGSELDNGDIITETPVEGVRLLQFDHEEPTEGFLVPHWTPKVTQTLPILPS